MAKDGSEAGTVLNSETIEELKSEIAHGESKNIDILKEFLNFCN